MQLLALQAGNSPRVLEPQGENVNSGILVGGRLRSMTSRTTQANPHTPRSQGEADVQVCFH